MFKENTISKHYTHGSLLDSIRAGIERLGKTPDTVGVEDLGPVDEFHIGGREASESFLDRLQLSPDDHVLDVGCGIGGTSRFVAYRYGSRVTGIDLTSEYIETGRVMCSWLGLEHLVVLEQGSAGAMPYSDGTFNTAYMMHVGMNIADKHLLTSELYRVLKTGARLAVYDVMRVGGGELTFPVPWASTAQTSFVATPGEYRNALELSGFRVVAERNRRDFALNFFARLQAKAATADSPPPLGLHIFMGNTAPLKIKNMIENISENRVAPVEIIAEKLS
ncbi:MAG: Sarcosine/dimethylglycine N-methyltransferase [Gammaproteobacteria bacterium]|nr:Sarcosine/dimethylglycine N-methyltransferase [Gammaproteobacteria bacterium]